MESVALFGRCVFMLVASIIICSVVIYLRFADQYNSLERKKFKNSLSLRQRISISYFRKLALKCGGYAKVSYAMLLMSLLVLALECVIFFFEHSIAVWKTIDTVNVCYLCFMLLTNSPAVLTSSSAAETTNRDFKAEYTAALQHVEQLQTRKDSCSKEFKQCVLQLQQIEFQYFRWLNNQRNEDFSPEKEQAIQELYHFFVIVEGEKANSALSFETSFCMKNMFFVQMEVYHAEFTRALEDGNIEDAIHIADLCIKKIGTVHDWNTEIGRDDRIELQRNYESWSALMDQIEQMLSHKENVTMKQSLLEVYSDASISLMTATADIKKNLKARKQRWRTDL